VVVAGAAVGIVFAVPNNASARAGSDPTTPLSFR
jgi:hypothetical protein